MTDLLILIFGAMFWLEFVVRLAVCKSRADVLKFIGTPLMVAMPSVGLGALARVIFLVIGSLCIVRYF